MAYGSVKIDTLIYNNGGSDVSLAVSGIPSASAINAKAPLASPTFTGTVTIPSGASIAGYATTASLSSYLTSASLSSYATLASPTFTGTVTIPSGANISGYATTASLSSYATTASLANNAETDQTQTFTAAQRGSISGLSGSGTVTPNFALSNNFSITLSGATTIANPSNLVAGQSGCIVITQSSGTLYSLSWGSYWKFAGGVAPDATQTASATDSLAYFVESSTRITARLLSDVK